jgi:glycerol-3-phosphate O-acyltransferase
MVEYGIALKLISREAHALGDIVRMSEANAVLATYFRNNILHLFALPSLIACVFVSNAQVSTWDIQRLARRIYPYIAAELFLRWSESELSQLVDAMLAAMAAAGLIEPEPTLDGWTRAAPASAQAMQLSLPGPGDRADHRATAGRRPAGAGWQRRATQATLEERCQLLARRMVCCVRTELAGILRPHHVRQLHRTSCELRCVIRAGG